MSKPGVHIIPAGLEYDRVVKPLLKDFTVSKAYILINENEGKDFGKQKEIIDRFRRSIKKSPSIGKKLKLIFTILIRLFKEFIR